MQAVTTGRKRGRPKKGDAPLISYEELDRLLVFGEVVSTDDGKGTTVFFPSYRQLSERFGVVKSVIADYARKHNSMRRREENQARIEAQVDQKMVEIRSTAIAFSRDEELRIIDGYIAGFEKAMGEGRVRFDNPSDLNTLIRLKEFIQGGADSRAEIRGTVTLEDLQARHREMLRTFQDTSPEVRGEVSRSRPQVAGAGPAPLAPLIEDTPPETTGSDEGDDDCSLLPEADESRAPAGDDDDLDDAEDDPNDE